MVAMDIHPDPAADVTYLAGLLLPESILSQQWFHLLAAFVAINTVVYVALAVAKTLPKLHAQDFLPRTYTRAETRSIYPDSYEGPDARPGFRGRLPEAGSGSAAASAGPEDAPEPDVIQ